MFDKTTVVDSLVGLVGWRQPIDPTYAILDAANLESRSGNYIDSVMYAKIPYVHQNQDYAGISDADFNTILINQQKDSIAAVCNQVFAKPDFRERHMVYEYPMNKVKQTAFSDSFVGYKIELKRLNNLALKFQSVVCDFATDGDFKILLFSSENPEAPLFQKDVTITQRRQVEQLGWVINNTENNYKGELYFGYLANGTTPQPFKREYNGSNILACWKDMYIQQIKVDGHTTETLFDLNNVDGLSDYTGLNANIAVYDDYTDWILANEHLFSEAIMLTCAIWAISTYATSLRSNKDQRRSNDDLYAKLLLQIEGNDQDQSLQVTGLKTMLSNQITAIKDQLEKLSEGFKPSGPYHVTQT